MGFPVAGSAVSIGVNLGVGTCPTGTLPTSVRFSALTLSQIFSGTITNWNDAAIVADNPGWNTGCTGAITRVVRNSKSGTTQTFKNFLKNSDGSRALCDGNTWTILAQDANNTLWPAGGACPAITTATGGGGVATTTASTDGAIGYADYPDWFGKAVKLASLGNAAGTAFVSPGPGTSGSSANCVSAFTSASLPGSSTADAVSLSPTGLNWATDATPNRSDLTYQGTGYPICALTFDFVYTGLRDTAGTQTNAIWRLTNDQRRTLYSYFTYVLSPAAQFRLTTAGYDQLPAPWLTKLRQGFQANF
jgi:ABC-type phosphate transport system substrate-binding protein